MASDRNLKIVFQSDATQVKKDLAQLLRETEQYGQGLQRVQQFAEQLKARIIAFGQAAVATGGQFEQLMARLRTALGSEGAAQSAFKTIQAFAATTPYEVSQVTEAFISLQNRGIKPTNDTLRKLGDIAGSQGKPLQQIVEALLDATQGEGERLKEFGIKASFAGEKATISFKNVNKTVEKTPESITKAILAIGEMKGVAGGMELQAATLTGKMSNLSDATDSVSRVIFELVQGPLKSVVDAATGTINAFLAFPPVFQKAVLVTGALTAAIVTLTTAAIAFELANGRMLISQTLLAAAKLKDVAVTGTLTAAQTTYAVVTRSATEAQLAQAQAFAVGALKVGLFAAALASLALAADTYLKVDAGAKKIRDSTESVEKALAGLAEVRANNAKGVAKAIADSQLEAAGYKRTREEIGGLQRFLDDYIRGPLPFLATATEASVSRQKVAFSDLALQVDKTLESFYGVKARGLAKANKDELEAQKKAIEASIGALEQSIPVDAADAAAKRERMLVLQKAKKELDALTAATEQNAKATEKALKKLKELLDETLATVKASETERLIATQRALNAGIITEEEAAQQRADIKRKSLEAELVATQDQLRKIEALPKDSDPEQEKARQQQIVSIRQKTLDLTLNLAENEGQQLERLKQRQIKTAEEAKAKRIKAIEDTANAEKRRSDSAIAGLEREKSAFDSVLSIMEQQNKLAQSRIDLQKAYSAYEQTLTTNQIDSLKRASDIRKQLDDGSIQNAEQRSALEKEFLQLTGNSSLTQLQVLQRRQQQEDKLAAQQASARAAEQAAQRTALENEIRRNKLIAERAVLEARIAEIRAKQQEVDAKKELEVALQSNDQQKIANAKVLYGLSRDGVNLAADNVKLSRAALADQTELAANSRTQLQVEQATANAAAQAADNTRENAQTEEIIKSGGYAGDNKRFDVYSSQGYQPPFTVIRPSEQLIKDALLTTTSPSASINLGASVTEILSQLKTMNSNLAAAASAPKTLNVSSPQPVTDAAKIWGDITYNSVFAAGLG